MTAIINFMRSNRKGTEGLDVSIAETVIDLFYRHQFTGTSPLVHSLEGAGGFSGAKFWRIEDDRKAWCLRRWPQSVNGEERRLLWIHRQLHAAYTQGCHFIPVPVISSEKDSLIEHQGFFWQLEPWMPGTADFHSKATQPRLTAAMTALAQFHDSVRSLGIRKQRSPGLEARKRRLAELYHETETTRLYHQIRIATEEIQGFSQFKDVGHHILNRFQTLASPLFQRLLDASQIPVPTQTVIGDVWHDHVLFSDDTVTGLIDFGTMRMDTPSCDIARLLGSLVGDEQDQWAAGIKAWEATCSLPQEERALIEIFDQTSTLISGINWLQWLFLEQRKFENLEIIIVRLESVARRMDFMAANL